MKTEWWNKYKIVTSLTNKDPSQNGVFDTSEQVILTVNSEQNTVLVFQNVTEVLVFRQTVLQNLFEG